jgi:hypothetical protein
MSISFRDGSCLVGVLIAGIVVATWSGCSHSVDAVPTPVIPAEGTVIYHGQAVAGAQLTFHNDDLPEPAFAVTDAAGKFQCMTNDSSDGIPAGEYIVTITTPAGGIPARYSAAESSPLQITVEQGAENRFLLELKD